MPGRNRFVFKPPYFPKFDSIAPSVIYQGHSRKLDYARHILRFTVLLMITVNCIVFALSIRARIMFGESIHECLGTFGETKNSNDGSVTVVIPQITVGIYILTFFVVFNGYNLLIQFLIVLSILECVTFIVWRYQFPYDNIELSYDDYFRIITQRMLRCFVVNNVNRTNPLDHCWSLFKNNYCPEWYDTEAVLCNKIEEEDEDNPIVTSENLINCYDRFKKYPWSTVSREEVYMNTVAPQTTMLMVFHPFAVTVMYIIARIYVHEYARLRTKWIEELQNYHAGLSSYFIKLHHVQSEEEHDFRMIGAVKVHKYLTWDTNKCEVCKEEQSSSHCLDWIVNPDDESLPDFYRTSMVEQDECQDSYQNVNEAKV